MTAADAARQAAHEIAQMFSDKPICRPMDETYVRDKIRRAITEDRSSLVDRLTKLAARIGLIAVALDRTDPEAAALIAAEARELIAALTERDDK